MNELFKHEVKRFYINNYMDFISLDSEIEDEDLNYYNKHGKFVVRNCYTTENQFVENYGNPLSSVTKRYATLVVVENLNKISIKLFTGTKNRRVGKTWFKNTKNVYYLTLNLTDGNIYSGFITNYQNKRKYRKSINKNDFREKPFTKFGLKVRNVFKEVDSLIDTEIIIRSYMEVISKRLGADKSSLDSHVLKKYLDINKVKYPNNFSVFYFDSYIKIPLKLVRKSNMKLVDAFMNQYGLKGQKLKKTLHECEKINVKALKSAYTFFSVDLINQDYDFLTKVLDYNGDECLNNSYPISSMMTPKEIKCVFNLYKNFLLENKISWWTFYDHITLYFELKSHGEEDLRWKSFDDEQFRVEHLDWSDKLDFYKKGTYFRIYPDRLIDFLNMKYEINNKTYVTKLLTNTSDYNSESSFQNNCVKTYIGKPSSLIISVTDTETEQKNRATVEYEVITNPRTNKIEYNRKQYLGKYNQRLSEDWDEVLFKLDEKVNYFLSNEEFSIKLKKICSNGKELFSDTFWDEDGKLKWTYNKIT